VEADGVVATLLRLDHTEHALFAVLGNRAVEELLFFSLDGDVDYKGACMQSISGAESQSAKIPTGLSTLRSVANTRYPVELFCLCRLVAEGQSRRESRGVVVGAGPDVADGVTDGCVDGERPVAEDALHGGNHDSVDSASALRRGHGLGWFPFLRRSAIFSDAFWMGKTDQPCSTRGICANSLDTQSS